VIARIPASHRVGPVTEWADRRTAFGTQAQAYAHGRPTYPMDAVRWVVPEHARTVLDLAAGTGKLTERVLELGVDVLAVEPLDDMRALIPAAAHALPGTAEQIPLPDASVDVVVVGQAFHWFDQAPALAEIARVLRPQGTLGLLWNLDDDRVPWVSDLDDLTRTEARRSLVPAAARAPYDDRTDLTTPEQASFDHAEAFDPDRLVAMVASQSRTILLPPDERERVLDAVRALAPGGRFPFPMVCQVWRGRRVGTSS
jgi:SAM-dependent methyltransferase